MEPIFLTNTTNIMILFLSLDVKLLEANRDVFVNVYKVGSSDEENSENGFAESEYAVMVMYAPEPA